MSFSGWKKYIEDGDLVIFYINRDNLSPVWIKKGKDSHNRFGLFKHDDLIGKEFGSRVVSSNYKGFIYLLHPTPELWTLVVPHRTQILYLPDISFITTYLDMKPGARVIESGTGSGSFSHSIARTIAPTGKLYSFEYHSERAELAAEEFRNHGISDLIELQHRDVCRDGFGLKDTVNAVFLDLPAPWEAIGSAKEAFKQHRTGKICTFSPCIEQVARSVLALNDHGFVEITMFECLIRDHEVSIIQKVSFEEGIRQAKERKENTTNGKRKADTELDLEDTVDKMLASKTTVESRGHTSYLTFATFLPAIQENTLTDSELIVTEESTS
ncbi:tRNA methyltransferase complex GCD14 subunit-domain-containing protein [Halteromyces radiatus]|uniref:tRNA methyltransferase complex GCD14 subunit-domain-containing protein n=1 Tax=Halteromyces radiatus TaxID=101107 RepID=UPI00221F2A4A|nr:tRNA methyltransferase complex GCD14 subunit-domain-containing protein [Halteromyces radiatus]KAI8076835.1 tRNA methyltransferase complex GCD14 subunit-domain-containing protein [Halteromyces radiatus]